MDSKVRKLLELYPGREEQIETLYNFYGHKNEPFPDCLYVYGGSSTGKTTIVCKLLECLDIKYSLINLIECYTSKILFETLLNKLVNHRVTIDDVTYAKCDNFMDFADNLKHIDGNINSLNRSIIVLDKADQLRNMDSNLLPAFLRLRELCGLNITVILISEILFQKYYIKLNIVEPIKVYFDQYNKEELLDILVLDYDDCKALIEESYQKKLDYNEKFFENYLHSFLMVFYRACRDLSELRYMAKLNFIKYCKPIFLNECTENESMILWRHIAPILKSSIEMLYLRIIIPDSGNPNKIMTKDNFAQNLELPFYAKYLLIAAYLASYNPAKDDKRLFVKHHGRKKKTLKDVREKSKTSVHLTTQLGPKAFSFDRLLAIFYAILDHKVGFNNNLLVQVSSLVELQLLTAVSDNFNLDGQKYKCAVSFDFIQTIAKMLGFNIRKYLTDFSHM